MLQIWLSLLTLKVLLLTWVAEGALIPESNPTLGSININAHKLATMVRISNELIADSVVAIESYVADLIAEAIAE